MRFHEVMRQAIGNVIHTLYKSKDAATVMLRFRADSGAFTPYGGTEKTDTDYDIKIIISPVANPKIWGMVAVMGESNLEAIMWEGFDTEMLTQFFEADNYDNIRIIVGEVWYRIKKVMSPE